MSRLTRTPWFKTVCYAVIYLFSLQVVHSVTIGFPQWNVSWKFGPKEACAQEPEWLASTVDANYEDRYIQEKLAEIGPGVDAVFAFVRDEIGYESYTGSLRGARGTLWSKAGNSLDQASLLIALLRGQGIPCRYVRGTLSDGDAKGLILSMFTLPCKIVGFIPEGAELSDPANDPQLLEETKEHYWVEFDDGSGSGFKALDPTFGNAVIDQTFAPKESTFAEVPADLRHKVTIRLKAELMGNLTGLIGGGANTKTVLNETFNTVELVGKPLSVGHFVNSY
ncbi:MAG: transglutaminase family protein [bacterium]